MASRATGSSPRRPARGFLPNRLRANLATIALGAMGLANLVQAVTYGLWLYHWDEIVDEQPYLTVDGWLRELLPLGLLVTGIVFVCWLWRAHGNATALRLRARFGQIWTVFGWIVPLVSIILPALIVLDLWRHAGRERVGSAAWVGLWWTGFVLGPLADVIADLRIDAAQSAEAMQDAMALVVVKDVATVATAALAIVIVRRLTRAHEAMTSLQQAEVFA